MAFQACERFTVVLLSWMPRYYEMKLLVLCWLIFRRGANSVYRRGRAALVQVPSVAGYLLNPADGPKAQRRRSNVMIALQEGLKVRRKSLFGRLPQVLRDEWSMLCASQPLFAGECSALHACHPLLHSLSLGHD